MSDWVNMRRSPQTLTGDTFCRAVTESKPYAWPRLHVSGGGRSRNASQDARSSYTDPASRRPGLERRFELLEELVADAAAPYGTQHVVGRKWNL